MRDDIDEDDLPEEEAEEEEAEEESEEDGDADTDTSTRDTNTGDEGDDLNMSLAAMEDAIRDHRMDVFDQIALDSSRFTTYISKSSGYPKDQIEALVIRGHGDTTMIPLTSLDKCNKELLTDILSDEEV